MFYGKMGLSKAFKGTKSWKVLLGVDDHAYGHYRRDMDLLCDKSFAKICIAAREPRQYWHIALPCDSSRLMTNNLNKGTRSKAIPVGDRTLNREVIGCKLLRRALIPIQVLASHGNYWSLENPRCSYVFHQPQVLDLLKLHNNTYIVDFDQCTYGLTSGSTAEVIGYLKYCRNQVALYAIWSIFSSWVSSAMGRMNMSMP